MLVYMLRIAKAALPPGINPPADAVCCETVLELVERLRTRCKSEPFVLLTYGIDAEIVEHIRFCFPDGFYVEPGCNIDEELRRIQSVVIPLRPEFHVRCDRIRYIECRSRKLLFYYPEYVRTTNYPVKKLPDLSGYGIFRCHGSFYVNFQYVDAATPDDFRMQGGGIAPISRQYNHVYRYYKELGRTASCPDTELTQRNTRRRS